MSVRMRTWTTGKGDVKEAWTGNYTDQSGKRHDRGGQKRAAQAPRVSESGADGQPRLLVVLESTTFAALAMGTFSGFVLGAGAAAMLLEQLTCAGG